LPSEPLHIFDPRRNVQLQGFAGRAATTTIHDATETGVSISGIFQAAEDFAVLGWWNAYDYFNHLQLKHLPKTDLSGLKLEFDIEYDQTLDGAIRLDAPKVEDLVFTNLSRLASQGEDIVNASLLALEKESIRRLDGLIGTIEKLIASAGQQAPEIREELQQLEGLRRSLNCGGSRSTLEPD
jgi:hypothetical protein